MTEKERLHRALLDAIAVGDTQSIRRVVAQGANLKHQDNWRRTPLILAALEGINGPAVVATLIELGADVNAQNNNGRTALVEALSRNDLPMARVLLKCGANSALTDRHGNTAIAYAHGRVLEALADTLAGGQRTRGKKRP